VLWSAIPLSDGSWWFCGVCLYDLILRLSSASWVRRWQLHGSSCDRRVSAALVERTAG
jgi:hypothetical protein